MDKETDKFLTQKQKNYLRNRILRSARGEKEREKEQKGHFKAFFAAAACVAILFTVEYYNGYKIKPSVEDLVRMIPEADIKSATDVTLILGNETNINLNEKQSRISYSTSGENVQIGLEKTIYQESVVNEMPVFNTVVVPYGKRTNLILSDGTRVWLNSGSRLIFPAVFNRNSRSVFLEGEAIFDVAHNTRKPFKVFSGSQEIEVLGTVFNVTSYTGDDVIETVLQSGSISLTYKDNVGNSLKLIPGSKATFNTETSRVVTEKVDVKDYFSWKEGFLSLNETNLEEIMVKLSRYYGTTVKIEDEDLAAETFSGKLDLRGSLGEVIELVRQTSHFEIQKNGDEILIFKTKKDEITQEH